MYLWDTATTVLKRYAEMYDSIHTVRLGRVVPATEMQEKAATVLCIDDEQPALQLRQTVLESAGYKVLTAKSGARGMQMFRSEPIHAVIVDYWMADMNGMQVAREIRKLNPKVPIIILSAYGELLDESVGIADLWIRKGEEDPEYLLDRLGDLLKSRAARAN
jgi:DNA-binding response OmpR family regulator